MARCRCATSASDFTSRSAPRMPRRRLHRQPERLGPELLEKETVGAGRRASRLERLVSVDVRGATLRAPDRILCDPRELFDVERRLRRDARPRGRALAAQSFAVPDPLARAVGRDEQSDVPTVFEFGGREDECGAILFDAGEVVEVVVRTIDVVDVPREAIGRRRSQNEHGVVFARVGSHGLDRAFPPRREFAGRHVRNGGLRRHGEIGERERNESDDRDE